MRYFMFVTSDESAWANSTPQYKEEIFGKYMAFTMEMQNAGVLLAVESLQPSSKGSRVQVRNGERTVVDGPWGEPSAVGGYYLIRVDSKDEALAWAAKCPGASYGTMEVREVSEFGK
ncbi:YciI family protein [Pendulispora brunnea]|uniref:YciI family protein n=1 Tax=Pendulispora brunnea TaxID=2905690 RepID=A0ABZ2KNU9_9BACT